MRSSDSPTRARPSGSSCWSARCSSSGRGSSRERFTKTKPSQTSRVDRPQRRRLAVDLLLLDHRRGDQRAVERVAPRVVGTPEVRARVALLVVAQPRAPVAADVVEPADRVVLAAHQQDALVGDLEAQPGTRPSPGAPRVRRRSSCGRRPSPCRSHRSRRSGTPHRAASCGSSRWWSSGTPGSRAGRPDFANCTVSQSLWRSSIRVVLSRRVGRGWAVGWVAWLVSHAAGPAYAGRRVEGEVVRPGRSDAPRARRGRVGGGGRTGGSGCPRTSRRPRSSGPGGGRGTSPVAACSAGTGSAGRGLRGPSTASR